jgi:hypothetical protein
LIPIVLSKVGSKTSNKPELAVLVVVAKRSLSSATTPLESAVMKIGRAQQNPKITRIHFIAYDPSGTK